MIVLIVFILVVLSDILSIIKEKQFRNNLDKMQFVQLITLFGGSLFGIYLLGNLFHLKLQFQVYLMVQIGVSVLVMFSYHLQFLQHKHEFEDLSQYMLRLCVYFRSFQKIQPSLLEAKKGFMGSFSKKLDEGLKRFEKKGDIQGAMGWISQHYLFHSLLEILSSSERVGHQHASNQLLRLEEDVESWIFQTKSYQKEEAQYRNRMMLLFGIGLAISYFAQNMLMQSMDMKALSVYQQLVFLFLALNILAILFLSKRLCHSWFLEREFL